MPPLIQCFPIFLRKWVSVRIRLYSMGAHSARDLHVTWPKKLVLQEMKWLAWFYIHLLPLSIALLSISALPWWEINSQMSIESRTFGTSHDPVLDLVHWLRYHMFSCWWYFLVDALYSLCTEKRIRWYPLSMASISMRVEGMGHNHYSRHVGCELMKRINQFLDFHVLVRRLWMLPSTSDNEYWPRPRRILSV
jgi:hypothetical protein